MFPTGRPLGYTYGFSNDGDYQTEFTNIMLKKTVYEIVSIAQAQYFSICIQPEISTKQIVIQRKTYV